MSSLFKINGSIAFLTVIFLNAFVDLGHKITIQNTIFKTMDGGEQIVLTAIVNAMILLPFILLFTPSGFVSDKYPKATVMHWSALAAVFICCFILLSYVAGWFWLAFALTFLLAMQSAFYGPAKLGYIKVLFGDNNITQGNGYAQAASMIAILVGTIAFSAVFEIFYSTEFISRALILQNMWLLGVLLIVFSVLEWILVCRLPIIETTHTEIKFNKQAYLKGQLLKTNIQTIFSQTLILWCIFGLCIFWTAGQVMLATFPAFVKEQVGLTNTLVLQLTLGSTGIGIMFGAILAGRLSQGIINTKIIFPGALGIIIGLVALPFLTNIFAMAAVFALVGLAGGLFVVPLNALIQYHADDKQLGSVLAGKNFFQNICMLSFLVLTGWFAFNGLKSQQLLLLLAVFVLFGCAVVIIKLKKILAS